MSTTTVTYAQAEQLQMGLMQLLTSYEDDGYTQSVRRMRELIGELEQLMEDAASGDVELSAELAEEFENLYS